MEPYQISLVIAIVLALTEVLTLTFIFLGFSAAFLVVALFQYLSGAYELNRDIVIFSAFSILFILIFRRMFRRKSDQNRMGTEDDVNSY
jgi:membrane protein implicated in regulation of membrane protease activity